jgi:uncharacterized C2H2 Zn-finger protein
MAAALQHSDNESDDDVAPPPVVQRHARCGHPPVEQAGEQGGSSQVDVDPYATESDDDEDAAVAARQHVRTQANAEQDRLDQEADAAVAARQRVRTQANAEQDRLDQEADAAVAARQRVRTQANAEQDRLDQEADAADAAVAARQRVRTQAKAERDRLDQEADAADALSQVEQVRLDMAADAESPKFDGGQAPVAAVQKKGVVCETCGSAFAKQSNLTRHVETKHTDQTTPEAAAKRLKLKEYRKINDRTYKMRVKARVEAAEDGEHKA